MHSRKMASIIGQVKGRSLRMVNEAHDEIGHVVRLMDHSPVHRRWGVADINRLIVPPIEAGQAVFVWDLGKLVGFGTFALLNDEAEAGYINGTRRLEPSDWAAGNHPWLIDAIAPWGHARDVTSQIRAACIDRGYRGRTIRFHRNYGDRKRYGGVAL